VLLHFTCVYWVFFSQKTQFSQVHYPERNHQGQASIKGRLPLPFAVSRVRPIPGKFIDWGALSMPHAHFHYFIWHNKNWRMVAFQHDRR
jgi:hypothetical protein